MGRKIKVPFQGKMVDATPIEVNQAEERWNSYLLDDGSTVKLKVVVTNVVRIDDAYDAEGNPIYLVQSTNVVRVDAPDSLKRK